MQIKWVNWYKAILIIFMVLGHSGSPLLRYIYLFHMPAFFIVSGYLFNENKYSFIGCCIKRIKNMLIPAILINVLFMCFYELMDRINVYTYFGDKDEYLFINSLKCFFYNLSCADFGGATWFIFVLFQVEILFYLIVAFLNKFHIRKVLLIITSAIGYVGYYLCVKQQYSRYMLELVLIAIFYYSLGYISKIIHVADYLDNRVLAPFSMLSIIFFGRLYFMDSLPMNWPTRHFAEPFVQIWSCLCGVYLVYIVSTHIKSKTILNYLNWLGQHTYTVLVLHFFTFRFIFLICYLFGICNIDIMGQLTPPWELSKNGGWIVISFFSILLCNLISVVSSKNVILNYLFNARGKNE